ncbi:MAG: glycosyltransferase family 39 protein [Archaeoglobaceae archaeon]
MKHLLIISFTLIAFLSNHYFLNDEVVVALQVQSIESNFSLATDKLIIYQAIPGFEFNGNVYAPFTYLLPIFAYPINKFLLFLNYFGYPDLILALIAPAGFLFLSLEYRKLRIPAIAFFLLNLILFKPIYRFEDWSAVYSVKFLNIVFITIATIILYKILREKVDEKVATSGAFLFVFATPIAYWTISAKAHALSLLMVVLSAYCIDLYCKSNKARYVFLSSVIAGLSVSIRSIDGIAIFMSILIFILIYQKSRVPYSIAGFSVGYIPCAIFGYAVFGIPLPVEIIGNLFSEQKFVRSSNILDLIPMIPLILFGINFKTLGMMNFSPILAILILPTYRAIKSKRISLSSFEKFLLVFGFVFFVLYLPFISSGVIDTKVRDYRFYLPLYFPLIYIISTKIRPEIDFSVLITTIFCYSAVTSVLVSIFRDYISYIIYVYFGVSCFLILVFILYEKFGKSKPEVIPLAILPVVFMISDQLNGYFGPYDVHFILPVLDRFSELLFWIRVILLLG